MTHHGDVCISRKLGIPRDTQVFREHKHVYTHPRHDKETDDKGQYNKIIWVISDHIVNEAIQARFLYYIFTS